MSTRGFANLRRLFLKKTNLAVALLHSTVDCLLKDLLRR